MPDCNHDRYRDETRYMTFKRAMRKMREGKVAWCGMVIKNCQDCLENIEYAEIVEVKKPEQIIRSLGK